jgi:hypothetical protein
VVTRESSIPDYGWLEKVGKEEVSNRFVEMRHPTPFMCMLLMLRRPEAPHAHPLTAYRATG